MTQPDLSIGLWREHRKERPWIAVVIVNGDERWIDSFDDLDDAFAAARRRFEAEEEALEASKECGACDGSGEGLFADTTCMQCNGSGTAPEEDE